MKKIRNGNKEMLEHEMGKVAIQLPRHTKMGNENENAEHQVFGFFPPQYEAVKIILSNTHI